MKKLLESNASTRGFLLQKGKKMDHGNWNQSVKKGELKVYFPKLPELLLSTTPLDGCG